MTAEPRFVHLRVHSEYSLVDGLLRVKPMVQAVAADGGVALGLTDQSNLFATVKFYKAALAAGIKPIVGTDLLLRPERADELPARLTLLCQNRAGYLNLSRLISRAYIEGQHGGIPMIERDWLDAETAQGLIALSGAREGDVGMALCAGSPDEAEAAAAHWAAIFPERYYLELIRTGREGEDEVIAGSLEIAERLGLPLVATNDVRFLAEEDFEAHEARVCIHDGYTLNDRSRPRRYSPQQYLRSQDEMCALFADLPEALQNSVEIARRCNLELKMGTYFLPDFPVPEGMSLDEYFRQQARAGLEERLPYLIDPDDPDAAEKRARYEARLETELDVIVQMQFPGYFLIVADFIQWAKRNGIPVGPGRGSGAGSLVAYALKITDLDPLRYDLLFERFLNPERVSMPDFDIDFCMDNRDRVIDYVARKYGRNQVSQIITYGSMAAKAVVRDVGRVLGHPYGFVDRIAKMIPFEVGMTLDKAFEQSEELREAYEQEEEVRALIDLARKLEGLARNAGKHAGGVVIAPSDLTDFVPLYCEQGGQGLVTQFDKDDVEAIGLVKFDFLGLRTLTIIDWAVQAINEARQAAGEDPLDINRLPLDDSATFDLIKRQETTAVFQVESSGMKDLIRRLQPDTFEDIVALVALFRPGPLQSGMVDDFINRKHGRASIEYPHPDLEPILKPTYGIILYQEQVMQIAQVLAGYTLGGADLLRRAMGKKKPEEMAKQREIFMKGAVERGVEAGTAEYIFDLMEKFAGYGFNKSHSAAYALLSYQTAWLKAHYPAWFMAAVLSADMDNTDKVVTLIDECRRMGLEVVPPDINRSWANFRAIDERTILYGLGAIKGVGEGAVEGLIEDRETNGPFAGMADFCRRLEAGKLNRRTLEAMIKAGALDSLGPNRASLMAGIPEALRIAEQFRRDQVSGQDDLFGEVVENEVVEAVLPDLPEWEDDLRLAGEKETLGLYLTGHPIDRYADELLTITGHRLGELGLDTPPQQGTRTRAREVLVAGMIIGIRVRTNNSGRKWAVVTLDDRSGRIEALFFADAFEQAQHLLAADNIVLVRGQLGFDERSERYSLRAQECMDLAQAREHLARRLVLGVDGSRAGGHLATALQQAIEPHRDGQCQLLVDYRNTRARVRLRLPREAALRPRPDLLRALEQIDGVTSVQLHYGRQE
ncbi:MAG: DNA polymerase III subunit alpha [Gammaproteobacteria bacterium]|nr:MAG: DNA polymerase III subunit alpha [Gammaproteobacteria bacterium]